MEPYSEEFYNERHQATVYSARTVLSILLSRIPAVNSAVDVGCGVGTWLSVLQSRGAKDILGVDGNWVNHDLLVIPKDCFKQVDLTQGISLPKKYDLAISLEVAEHLPSSCAAGFVSMLTQLSNYVLFSAAIPDQGGVNHINEQWPDYWVKLFAALDYHVHDFIRAEIWNDPKIPVWYRQNILLFSRLQPDNHRSIPLNVVHPDLYRYVVDRQVITRQMDLGVRRSFTQFLKSLKKYCQRWVHALLTKVNG